MIEIVSTCLPDQLQAVRRESTSLKSQEYVRLEWHKVHNGVGPMRGLNRGIGLSLGGGKESGNTGERVLGWERT